MSHLVLSRGAIVFGAAGLLLAACHGGNPVGTGQGPVAVRIAYGAVTDQLQTVECATVPLTAIATFDGDKGRSDTAVTNRVHWSSDQPGVIDVSNGDIETAPGSRTFYPPGTVVAHAPGNAVISVNYGGLVAGFNVSAGEILSTRIAPALTRMAPNSQTTFKLYVQARNDQLEQDLTGSAIWSFPGSAPAATLSAISTVQALAQPLDAPFELEANLHTCDLKIPITLSVGEVDHLALTYEQPTTTSNVPLVLGDRVRVDAVFKDTTAPNQNLSDQVTADASVIGYNPNLATVATTATTTETVAGVTRLAPNSYLLINGNINATDSPVAFQLTYDLDHLNLKVNTRVYDFQNVDIVSTRVDQSAVSLDFPNLGRLNAYATFQGESFERPISRYISWSVADSSLLTIANGADGGLLTPANLGGLTTVFANVTSTAGSITEKTSYVTVQEQH